MLKVNDMIKVHFYNHDYSDHREIKTRISDNVFRVYKKDGKLGFDGNPERSPYTCKGDVFTPFSVYASSVIFENVETGAGYYFSNINNELKKKEG